MSEMGMYCIWDKELPEVVEALQFHIERLGHTYANDAELDPMEGARRIGHASDLCNRLLESMAELQEAGRVPAYNQEQRRKMLLEQVAHWERMQEHNKDMQRYKKDMQRCKDGTFTGLEDD